MASIIVFPGVGTLPVDSWRGEENEDIWLKSSVLPVEEEAIYTFENRLSPDGALLWSQVEEEGARCLAALDDLVQQEKLRECPVVLVAHSLGGLVLKRAMCLAYGQPQRFRILLRNVSGAVLLSCLHSRSDELSIWEKIPLILKTYSKSRTKQAITQEVASNLARDCFEFEQIFDTIPVLSLFETEETKTGGLFGLKMVLMDWNLVKTNTKLQSQCGVRADHNCICGLKTKSHEMAEVARFIRRIVEETSKIIEMESSQDHKPSSQIQEPSIDESSSVPPQRRVLRQASLPCGSNQANTAPSKGSKAYNSSIDINPSLSDFSFKKNDPHLPCHMMPLSRNRGFFGRQKVLEDLDKALAPASYTRTEDSDFDQAYQKTFVICGPGGIGKTQLASQFVYRRKSDFDAIFWVHADEPSKIAQDFNQIALSLGLVDDDTIEARDRVLTRDLVLGWLRRPLKSYKQVEYEQTEEASCLLIFDNVDDADILDDYWPIGSSASVIITSRDPIFKTYTYSGESGQSSITLPSFDDNEAMQYLLKLTNREKAFKEHESGKAVVRALGGLPLAISQMAGFIARNDLSFVEFQELYEKESAHPQLFNFSMGLLRSRSNYDHTIATVWALQNLEDKAGNLLSVLSLLDPDGIPEYIPNAAKSIWLWEGYPKGDMEYQDARTELLKSSLVTRDRTEKKIFIHRLIQDAARASISDEQFNQAFGFTLCQLSAHWPYEDFGFGNEQYRWARCNELYRHALRMKKFFERFSPPTKLSKVSIEPPKFLLDLARFCILSSNFSDTIPFLEMAQSMCQSLEKIISPADQEQSDLNDQFENLLRRFHHHRGELSLHTNQPEVSLSSYRTFINMLRERFGDEPRARDKSLGVAWNELGCAFLQNDRAEEAEDSFKKSIDALKALGDSEANDVSMPIINLAFAYWLQNRLDDAAATFEEALTRRENAYGENDGVSFVTGKLLLGFGNVKTQQNLLDESFALHQRCLLHYKSTVGNHHHRTGDGCVKVAGHYVRLNQYGPALDLMDQALKIYGDNKHFIPEKSRVQFRRGNLLRLMGREQEAQQELNQAYNAFQQIRPGYHKSRDELQDSDFDQTIMFWSR